MGNNLDQNSPQLRQWKALGGKYKEDDFDGNWRTKKGFEI